MKNKVRGLLIFFIFTGIFFGASCLKKTDLVAESLGDAVAPEQVSAAISEGFGVINYNDMKPNEVTNIMLTQTIQDGSAQILEEQAVTIKKITNASTYLLLDVFAAVTKRSSTGSTTTSRDWQKYFTKYSGYALSVKNDAAKGTAEVDEPMYLFQVVQNLALGSCYNDGNYPETCHNLSTTDIDFKVPTESAGQYVRCQADIFNCYIKAKKIEFDLIRKYEFEADGSAKRIHYTLVLTQDAPFSSRLLKYCSRALYDIPGATHQILADLCYNVGNYAYGQ